MAVDIFHHQWLGGLFADPDISDLISPERTLRHMVRVEAAYLRALGKIGKVAVDHADAVASQIEEAAIEIAALRSGVARDGVVVPELVRQLQRAVEPESRDLIHSGLTSQDVVDTALVLSLRDIIEEFDRRLERLVEALAELTARYGDTPLMGRTRMQAANWITVADRIAIWSQPLVTHRARLSDLTPRLLQLQLGGAAGDRSAFGDDADALAVALAGALGLGCPDRAWHTARDSIAEFASWLSLVSGALGKMGQDIVLMAQQGIGEVNLSGGGRSSSMPHKQNPVLAETLITLAGFNATLLPGMHRALVHEQERSGSAWMLEWMILPQMILTTGRGLGLATDLTHRIDGLGGSD